jgi:uncharacterized membrane protein YgcG
MNRRGLALSCATVIAAALLAGPAGAATLNGTVVHVNSHAHSFTLASKKGRLSAVHARHSPPLGAVVTVDVRRLGNGTYRALHITSRGRRVRHVRISGAVTYRGSRSHSFVVSARGVSILVYLRRSGTASGRLPRLGADVSVEGTLDSPGEVTATNVEDAGQDPNGLDLEGVVVSVDQSARTLSVSADDDDESGGTVTVDVPNSFDLTQFQAGQEVELIVAANGDGTYTLLQSSDDGGDPGQQQGDGSGDSQPNPAQECRSEQNDPNFPATHNGESFDQFYGTNPNDANAFGMCVSSQAGGGSGEGSGTGDGSGSGDGSNSGAGGSDNGGSDSGD